MNDTSITMSSGAYGSSSAVSDRAFRRSMTVTRGSDRSRQSSSPYATSRATTCSAPRWSRQSVKPPVEAPTSSARRSSTANSSASRALASLIPPRETNGGRATTSTSTSSATSWPGFSARRRSGSSSTSPASTDAAARERDANSPLSQSNISTRTRFIRRGTVRD